MQGPEGLSFDIIGKKTLLEAWKSLMLLIEAMLVASVNCQTPLPPVLTKRVLGVDPLIAKPVMSILSNSPFSEGIRCQEEAALVER